MRAMPAVPALVLAAVCVGTALPAAAASSALTTPAREATAASTSRAVACGPVAVSHRGLGARAPENTLRAYRGVLRQRVRVLETDVRFTRDQVPVIMHDATVDRTTDGHGRVADLAYAEIARLDAGDGTRVPRLGGLVDLAARRGASLLVEIKPPRATVRQVRTVLRVLRARGMQPRTTVQSFSLANVQRVHRMAPRLHTALLVGRRHRVPSPVPRAAGAVAPQMGHVTRTRVRRWQRTGHDVYAWVADRPRQWRRLARAGVDAVISDRAGAYLRWLRRRCG